MKNKMFIGVVILICFSGFRSSFLDWCQGESQAMLPNIHSQEIVFVNRLAYEFRLPWFGLSLFKTSHIKRGDVVLVVRTRGGDKYYFLKRVIGLPGDKLVAVGRSLSINGVMIDRKLSESQDLLNKLKNDLNEFGGDDNYELFTETIDNRQYQVINSKTRYISMTPSGELSHQVAADHVYLLGDNRENSLDSRYEGDVAIADIVGKAF